jgi:tetratricopeptide (TPR) repeat protein
LKPSENLFELIKVLSEEEKETIVNSSGFHVKGEENKYLTLFNLILKQQTYNEEELVKHFKLQKDPNKFAFLKNYTYNFILDSLEEKSSFVLKVIHSKLNQAEVLLEKKLFDIALFILDEAEFEAEKRQLYEIWAEIYRIKLNHYKEFALKKPVLEKKHQLIISAQKSFYHYRKLFSIVRCKHHQSAFTKDIENAPEFKAVHEVELLESDSDYNFHHKLFFYLSKGIVYYAKRDFDKSYIMVNELLKLWNKYPWMIDIRFGGYYNTLYNKALIESNYKQYEKALESCDTLLTTLKELHRKNPFHYFMVCNLKVSIYTTCGYFDKAVKMADVYSEARAQLPSSAHNPNSEQRYHFYQANIFFGVGDYKSANKHINEIINNAIEYNNDITCLAQLMSLVIHYEMGNLELLNYRIKSVYRFISKKNCLQLTIAHVLEFLKKAIKADSMRLNKELVLKLKEQIKEDIQKDPIESAVLDYFDILSWLDSKIEQKPFMAILKAQSDYCLD